MFPPGKLIRPEQVGFEEDPGERVVEELPFQPKVPGLQIAVDPIDLGARLPFDIEFIHDRIDVLVSDADEFRDRCGSRPVCDPTSPVSWSSQF